MNISALLEVTFVFTAVECIIWFLSGMGALPWIAGIVVFCFVLKSWHMHGDTLENLGLAPNNFYKDSIVITLISLIFLLIVFMIALFWNPEFLNQENLSVKIFVHFNLYYFWALFQNLCLNGYFVNRLNVATGSSTITSLFSGILFSVIHWPNPVLLIATLAGGIMSAYFFQRNKNLYFISAAHAIIAVSLLYFFPDSWHNHLTIGPGFYTWKP